MPKFGPISRSELIRYLRRADFAGPYSGKRHQYMQKESLKLFIPNPHQGDISKGLLAVILREAGISRKEWENL
ncbi:MAG: type II toxin-antitoxin system HicA family toxin [Crocosphaera sp.]